MPSAEVHTHHPGHAKKRSWLRSLLLLHKMCISSPPPLITLIRASLLVLCHTNAVIPTVLVYDFLSESTAIRAGVKLEVHCLEGLIGGALGAHWIRENHFPEIYTYIVFWVLRPGQFSCKIGYAHNSYKFCKATGIALIELIL